MFDFIKRLKFIYAVYNFFQREKLIHNEKTYRQIGLKKKYYSPVSNADFKNLTFEIPLFDRSNSKIILKENPVFQKRSLSIWESILNWSDNGYAIFKNFFIFQAVDEINAEMNNLIPIMIIVETVGLSEITHTRIMKQ